MKTLILSIITGFILTGLYFGYQAIKITETPKAQASWIPFTEITAVTSKYTAIETCSKCITANGTVPSDITVACPREIKLGTSIEIDGKMYKCDDRTNIRYNGRFDIFGGYTLEDWQRAKEYGLQTKLINIYE